MFVIIGGAGFLGNYLIKKLLKNTNDSIIASFNSTLPCIKDERVKWVQLDLQNQDCIYNFFENIKYVKEFTCVFLAGYIKPDLVYSNPDLAWKINIDGFVKFLSLAKNKSKELFFASTDMVMGESVNDYRFKESDHPNPINLYGKYKATCENLVNLLGYTVIRFPLMVGKSINTNKIGFFDHIEKTVNEKKIFDVLSDYFECSLDYNTVADILSKLIVRNDINDYKIINICSDEKISKFQIAIKYCESHKLDSKYIRPISLKKCNFFKAKRGTILLDNSLIKEILSIKRIVMEF